MKHEKHHARLTMAQLWDEANAAFNAAAVLEDEKTAAAAENYAIAIDQAYAAAIKYFELLNQTKKQGINQ